MAKFYLDELVPEGQVVSAALGASAAAKLNDKDIGKAVKLANKDNYVLCEDGDEIEGFITSIEPYTVNDGFSFGGVALGKRRRVTVATGESVSVGDLVVAGAQAAANTAGKPIVKAAAAETPPEIHKWRVVSLLGGNGAAGTEVVIERV